MVFRFSSCDFVDRFPAKAKRRTTKSHEKTHTYTNVCSIHLAFCISTANTCVGPNMFERKTIHFMSGVKVTFGSRL